MKKLLLLLIVLIAITSCESRSGRLVKQRENQNLIAPKTIKSEPYIKMITGPILIERVAWVGVIEIDGIRYLINGEGGIFQLPKIKK